MNNYNNNYIANLERMMIELLGEVRTLTNEVRDVKAKVDGMENIIKNRFPSVTFEPSADQSEVTFQSKVTTYTIDLNRFGSRNIDRVTSSARSLYLVDGPKKKTTPGIVASITGALMDICQVEYKEGKEMYDKAYNLGKRVKRSILEEEAVRWNDWTSMEMEYKRYYCLQLEDLANSESIPLYRCKGQWAAFLIMAQIMRPQNVVPHNEVAMDTREDRNMDRESSLDSLLCEQDHDNSNYLSSSGGADPTSFVSSSFDYSHYDSYDNSGLDPLFNGMQSTSSSTPSNINRKRRRL